MTENAFLPVFLFWVLAVVRGARAANRMAATRGGRAYLRRLSDAEPGGRASSGAGNGDRPACLPRGGGRPSVGSSGTEASGPIRGHLVDTVLRSGRVPRVRGCDPRQDHHGRGPRRLLGADHLNLFGACRVPLARVPPRRARLGGGHPAVRGVLALAVRLAAAPPAHGGGEGVRRGRALGLGLATDGGRGIRGEPIRAADPGTERLLPRAAVPDRVICVGVRTSPGVAPLNRRVGTRRGNDRRRRHLLVVHRQPRGLERIRLAAARPVDRARHDCSWAAPAGGRPGRASRGPAVLPASPRFALVAPAVVLVYLALANSPVEGTTSQASRDSRVGGVQAPRNWIDTRSGPGQTSRRSGRVRLG